MAADLRELPLVSIIALCYNQEKYCLETLESVHNQSFRRIEVIVIDDCSTDHSADVISHWLKKNESNARFIRHEENRGICRSLNEGLGLCAGKYIQIVSCDDLLLPDKIDHQVSILEGSADDEGLVYSDAYIIDAQGLIQSNTWKEMRGIRSFPSGDVYMDLLRLNFIQINSCLFKRSAMEVAGDFDENLSFEDYDYFLRFAKRYKILYSGEISIKYRQHHSNISRQLTTRYARSYFGLLEKQTGVSEQSDEILRIRMLEVTMGKMMSNYGVGREMYKQYKEHFSLPWVLDQILKSKVLVRLLFWLPFKYRKGLMGLRNRMLDPGVGVKANSEV